MSDEGAGPQVANPHQHSLLELSVQKLQEEQAKHGIEPRLLRFVLINNAIKALQANLMDADNSFSLFRDPSTNHFLTNTLNHGHLSSPPSPAKVAKLDVEHFPTDSPLTGNSASFPALGCNEFGDDNIEYTPPTPLISGSEEVWLRGPSSSCKRNETRPDGDYKRKRPRNLTLDQLHTETDEEEEGEFPSPSPSSSPSTESSSLSPIDFAKVDVSLYDFDARTNLMFPPVPESTTRLPSGLSCSRQAQPFVCTPEPELEPPEGAGQEEDEDPPIAIEPAPEGTELSNGNSGHTSSSSSSVSSLSPEGFDGFDDSHEIDRIVSLLMT